MESLSYSEMAQVIGGDMCHCFCEDNGFLAMVLTKRQCATVCVVNVDKMRDCLCKEPNVDGYYSEGWSVFNRASRMPAKTNLNVNSNSQSSK